MYYIIIAFPSSFVIGPPTSVFCWQRYSSNIHHLSTPCPKHHAGCHSVTNAISTPWDKIQRLWRCGPNLYALICNGSLSSTTPYPSLPLSFWLSLILFCFISITLQLPSPDSVPSQFGKSSFILQIRFKWNLLTGAFLPSCPLIQAA